MILYKNNASRIDGWRVLSYIALILTAVLILLPLLVILSSSFKKELEIFAWPMTVIPAQPTFDNFRALLSKFPLYFFNSFKVTLLILVVQLFTATTGGYAFAKLKWKGSNVLFVLYIASIMVPIQTYIIPQFVVVRTLGLYNTQTALVLVSSFSAFGIFLTRQFFLSIPDSLIDAARIDGAGEYRIFGGIILPLSRAVIATLVIFSFRWFWNDFFLPLIYLTSQSLKTLPLGMADFTSEYFVQHGPQMAACLISILPVLAVFLLAQKHMMQSVVATGIKG